LGDHGGGVGGRGWGSEEGRGVVGKGGKIPGLEEKIIFYKK